MTKNDVLAALHEIAGKCGHCGNRSCPGRDAHSKLPDKLSTDDVLRALKMANRAVKKRRQCRELDTERSNQKTATLEMGTSSKSGESAEPGVSRPAAAPADQPVALSPDALHIYMPSTSDGQTWRCFICGGGELGIRHAGKPVTKGGNP